MTAAVPTSTLTSDQLLKLANFRRELADALDAAFIDGSGSGTLNRLPKWTPNGSSLGDSLLEDTGTYLNYGNFAFYVTAATGDTGIAGAFYAPGRGSTSTPTVEARRTVAASTHDDVAVILGKASGTWDTTSGDKYAYGVRGQVLGTRSAGAGVLRHWGVYGRAGTQSEAASDIHTRIGVNGGAYEATVYTAGATFRGESQTGSVFGAYAQADTGGAGPTMGMYGRARTGPIRVGTIGMAEAGGATTNIGIYGTNEVYTETFPTGTWAGYFNGNTVVIGDLRSGATGPLWASGTGSPEGVKTAPIGSMWSRTDGSTGTALYRKETGAGNTGWVAVAAGTGTVTGSGTLNAIPLWTPSGTALGNSIITQNVGATIATVTGGLSTTGDSTFGDGGVRVHTMNGKTDSYPQSTQTAGFTVVNVDIARAADLQAFRAEPSNSFNCTAAARAQYGAFLSTLSTRNSGAFALTNYGIYANAANAQTNYSGYFDNGLFQVNGNASFAAALAHTGTTVGFYNTAAIVKQTGVAVTAAAIHAALVNLGLIAA